MLNRRRRKDHNCQAALRIYAFEVRGGLLCDCENFAEDLLEALFWCPAAGDKHLSPGL